MNKRLKAILKRYGRSESVLIYQMGKVGSTSLETSLKDSLHLHTLYDNPPCYIHRERLNKNWFRRLLKRISDMFKRYIINRREHIKIISLMREPYARNVSMYFQDLPYWMVRYQERYRYDSREEGSGFVQKAFEVEYDHYYFDHWFDKELKRLTGIDIFSHPFDKEQGCSIIRKGRYDVMLIKLEMLDNVHEQIEQFVGYPFEMRESNKGEQKWYACIYGEFKTTFRPTEQYLEQLYDTKTVRHFYTEAEIAGFKNSHLPSRT